MYPRSPHRSLLLAMLIVLGAVATARATPVTQTPPDWSVVGESVDVLGEAVAGLGDVNGDGWDDVAVVLSGGLLVYLGSEEGLDESLALVGEEFGEDLFFPNVVAPAGDVNGDGYADLIAGAPFTGENVGAAILYYGAAEGFAADHWRGEGETDSSQFGYAVSGGADLNGDGYDDIAIGAPGDFEGDYPGSVFAYLGGPDGLGSEPLRLDPDDDAAGRYGEAVSIVGDVDGDGFADLLVGAPEAELVELRYGSAAGLESEPGMTILPEEYDFIFGDSLASLGDINDDGYADFAVNAANIDDSVKLYVYLGSPAGPADSADFRIVRSDAGELEGTVGRAGDVNGDGYDDLLFGLAPPIYADEGYGEIRVHFGGPAGVNADADAVLHGVEMLDGFGLALDAAGDVNGDGYGDVVAGAPDSELGGSFSGAAYLYLGSANGVGGSMGALTLDEIWTAESPEEGAYFGYQALPVGDINADGYDDVLLTGPGIDDFQGAAGLYLNGPDGLEAEPSWIFEGETGDSALGFQAAALGDANGDGYADVLLSAPFYEDAAGAVYLFYGNTEGLDTAAGWFVKGDVADEGVGAAIAGLGDVNGDGYADAAVVISDQGDGDLLRRVLVYHGGPDGLSTDVMWQTEDEDGFGHHVIGAGDINGDGFDELLLTPFMYDEYEGAVLLYHGSEDGLELEPAFVTVGESEGDNLGAGLAAIGDMDGDGYDEIAVGVPGHDGGAGAVHIYAGGAEGLDESVFYVIEGTEPGARFGAMVAPAGDVNGDGLADLVVAEDENPLEDVRAFVYLGGSDGPAKSSALEATVELRARYNWGARVQGAGDLDGDGAGELIVGEPGFPDDAANGRVAIYSVRMASGDAPGMTAAAHSWSPSATWTTLPSYEVGLVGWPATIVGDINSDGYADLLTGELGEGDDGPISEIQLYLGGPDGPREAPDWFVTHETVQSALDSELGFIPFFADAVGDVNGDGYDDLLVSWVDEDFESGVATFFAGGADGPSDEPDWLVADSARRSFGFRSVSAGDVNGDGYADIAVFGGSDDGALASILLYYGSADGPETEPGWIYDAAESIEGIMDFGTVGDLNGDGYDEFVVGSPGYPEGDGQGLLLLFRGDGDGLETEPFWTLAGDAPDTLLGATVSALGDVNGDGVADFGYGEPGYADGEGRATIVLVDPAGPDTSTFLDLEDGQAETLFGLLIKGLGDVNGDGYDDFVVGSTTDSEFGASEWSFYLGNAEGVFTAPNYTLSSDLSGEFLFFYNVTGGDVDGDGSADFALSEADFGALQDAESVGKATVFFGAATQDAGDADDRESHGEQPDAIAAPAREEDADKTPGQSILDSLRRDRDADDGTNQGDNSDETLSNGEGDADVDTSSQDTVDDDDTGSGTTTDGSLPAPTEQPEPEPLSPASTPEPEESNPLVEVIANTLNVRQGPGTNYEIVAQVEAGAVFAIAGQALECGWLLIEDSAGAQGWVSGAAQFVQYDTPCTMIPAAEVPEPPAAAPVASAPSGNARQGCYFFVNNVGPELTVTFTRRGGGFNGTFKVPPDGTMEYCLDPGEYTYTIDAPPPWNSINGELTVNAGDQFRFPVGRE